MKDCLSGLIVTGSYMHFRCLLAGLFPVIIDGLRFRSKRKQGVTKKLTWAPFGWDSEVKGQGEQQEEPKEHGLGQAV